MSLNKLLGRTIVDIFLSDDKRTIQFLDNNGESLYYLASGECCSVSWINNVTGISNLLGYKIIDLIEREEEKLEHKPNTSQYEEECISLYSFTLVTPKGSFDVEFRNSSNGYYGGIIKECPPTGDTKRITEDF